MRTAILTVCLSAMSLAQSRPPAESVTTNLPAHPIGPNDLLSVSVYDAPELSRTVRVTTDGHVKLPMLKQPIHVGGTTLAATETAIAAAIQREEILVSPVVTVSVAEYSSRPINVAGAVKQPQVFQAVGSVRLLDALSRAGGLTEFAGNDILVTKESGVPRRIAIKSLFKEGDAAANITLTGGEEIRVLEAGRAFVVGTVKKPGSFVLHDAEQSTVLQMLAMAEGLMPYASKMAYIYRRAEDGTRKEVPVELDRILRRKHEDVGIVADDILYIPESTGRRVSLTTLDKMMAIGSAGASALVYGLTR